MPAVVSDNVVVLPDPIARQVQWEGSDILLPRDAMVELPALRQGVVAVGGEGVGVLRRVDAIIMEGDSARLAHSPLTTLGEALVQGELHVRQRRTAGQIVEYAYQLDDVDDSPSPGLRWSSSGAASRSARTATWTS